MTANIGLADLIDLLTIRHINWMVPAHQLNGWGDATSFHPEQEGSEGMLPNLKSETGKIGYIILWLLGVPACLLFLIFLLRGCHWDWLVGHEDLI